MWSLSSVRKLAISSPSPASSFGLLKSISSLPSRLAPFSTGASDGGVGGETRNFTGLKRNSPDQISGQQSTRFERKSPDQISGSERFYSPPNASPGDAARTGPPDQISEQQRFYNPPNVARGDAARSWNFVKNVITEDNRQSRYAFEQNPDVVMINMKRNNTFINVMDHKGNTKYRASSGFMEVGAGKITRYGGEAAAEFVGRKAREMGLKSVVMRVKGFTFFKKKRQAIMSFREGFSSSRADNPIVYIEDVTQKPHNGCRLPKRRRI